MGKLVTLRSLLDSLPAHGERPAVLSLQNEGAESWSYTELSDHAARLAAGLSRTGAGRGDRVVLLAPARPEWIVACLAAIGAGAVVVPLDVQLGDDALGRILADSGTRLTLSTSDQADRLQRLLAGSGRPVVLLDAGEEDERGWRRLLADAPEELPRPAPEDPAVLFYTSGTTGAPKGALLTHANLAFELDTVMGLHLVRPDDRVLLPLPLHHVYPFVIGMLLPLATGLTITLPHALTGPQIVRALREGQATAIIGVPRLYAALYSAIVARSRSRGRVVAALLAAGVKASARLRRSLGLRVGKLAFRPLHREFGPHLRLLASGGAALDPELAWNLEGLGWQIAIGYGLTETSPLLTVNPPGTPKLESAGRPIPGVELRIDASALPETADGEQDGNPPGTGEIMARGPNVFAGYHNLPEKTAEAFADGWLRTGDLGYFDDDGYLYVLGRGAELIVTSSGENIQPESVEQVYLESKLVREIGILQREGRLAAMIVPDLDEVRRRGLSIDEATREAVGERSRRLPSYQRVGDYVATREPLPRTSLGKLRRHLLPELYERALNGEERVPHAGPISEEEMSAEDRALLEDAGARAVWEWLAGRYPDRRLTPDSSLQFDLGVDSLEWVDLTLEIGRLTSTELGEEAIGRIETVRDLLREASERGDARDAAPPIPSMDRPEEALGPRQRKWLTPLGPVQRIAAHALHALNRALMRRAFRLRARGLENLPREGGFVLAPNHASYLDPFAVAAALDGRSLGDTYWAGWTGVTAANALTRLFSRITQVIPIDSQRALFSSLALGATVVRRGKNLVWFPEGRRSPTGQLQGFKPGIGMLLAHSPVPVVPVYIHGAHSAWPPGRLWIHPAPITVVFGPPLDPRDLERQGEGAEPYHRIAQALHDRVARLGDSSGGGRRPG